MTGLRDAMAWYPDDIWRYVLACDWQRLDQELPLMGRAGDRGDELGSRVIAARLVDIAVHLGFLLSRTWPPYSKWRGSSFGLLSGCTAIAADLGRTLDARHWHDRQAALSDALTGLALLQQNSGLPVLHPAVEPFWDRPYVHLNRGLVPALLETLTSPEVQALSVGVGSVEQQTNNVDILTKPERRLALATSIRAHPRAPRTTS